MPESPGPPEAPNPSEQALARAFSLSPAAITITSLATGRLVEVNDSFVTLSGYTRKESLGRTPVELGLWIDPGARQRGIDAVRARQAIRDWEVRFRAKDGTILDCVVAADQVLLDGQPCALSVIVDVTDRKRALEQRDRSERLFRQILEATPDIVYIYDLPSWRVVYANRGAESLFGLSLAELQSLDEHAFRARLHPDDADRVLAEMAALASIPEGEALESEFRVRRFDGTWRWLRRRDAGFLRDGNGRVVQFVGVARDVTDEKAIGETIRQSEERLRLATELAGFGTYDIDLVGDTGRWTDRLLEIYGLTPSDGTHPRAALRSLVHPEDLDRVSAEFDLATAEGSSDDFQTEHRIIRPNGEIRWVIAKGRVVFSDVGGVRRAVRALGAVVDITDHKRAAEAVRNSEALFRSLADTAPTIIWTAAPDGSLTFHNRQWLRYTGLAETDNVDGWAAVVHPADHTGHFSRWTAAVAAAIDHESEVRFRRHDGEYRWFLIRATPVRGLSGAITAWFGSSTDIHDRKQSEEARERLVTELALLDRRKDEFLAMLSHELRNPLAPIRNAVDLLRRDGVDQRSALWAHDVIQRQVEHLSHLIDDLLDVSRIASGKVRLESQPIELVPILRAGLEASRPLIESRKQLLTVDLPGEPVWVEGDQIRLAQVVTNLLNNAAKYTGLGGRIWVSVALLGSDVRIAVRDDGEGIPPDLLPHVFDLFTQADRSLERAQGGLGVGLSLVKSLVELHGGTVQAASEGVGTGSEFVVTLPVIANPAEGGHGSDAEAAAGGRLGRILVVDDNRDLAESTALLLELTGHEVAVAFDGPTALEAARRFQPSVVLLDVGLPGMDGYQVAEALRNDRGSRVQVVIALTGYGMAEDRARSKAAGFDHHLVKPVDFAALEALLRRTL